MKYFLISTTLILNLAFSTFAVSSGIFILGDPSTSDDCEDCIGNLISTGREPKVVDEFTTFNEEQYKLQDLATQICGLYKASTNIPGDTKELVSSYMIENDMGAPTTANMIKFLNQNKNHLQCYGRNYIKYSVIKKSYEPMIYKLLTSELVADNNFIDFNAVDIVNGKPETLLDYIDSIIADPDYIGTNHYTEIKKLRAHLTDKKNGFGAKNHSDLSNDKGN